jgi:hypothetical protein
MQIEKIIEKAIEPAVPEIQRQLDIQNFTTSGRLKRSVIQNGTKIYAFKYIRGLLFGAPPTKPILLDHKPNSKLHEWVKVKLKPNNPESSAYLVARKLREFGNKIYRGESPPLDLEIPKKIILINCREMIKFAKTSYIFKWLE